MHVQSCCFGHKTYCFFDFLVAVAVALLKLPNVISNSSSHPDDHNSRTYDIIRDIAREARLINKAKTLHLLGINRRDETRQ